MGQVEKEIKRGKRRSRQKTQRPAPKQTMEDPGLVPQASSPQSAAAPPAGSSGRYQVTLTSCIRQKGVSVSPFFGAHSLVPLPSLPSVFIARRSVTLRGLGGPGRAVGPVLAKPGGRAWGRAAGLLTFGCHRGGMEPNPRPGGRVGGIPAHMGGQEWCPHRVRQPRGLPHVRHTSPWISHEARLQLGQQRF